MPETYNEPDKKFTALKDRASRLEDECLELRKTLNKVLERIAKLEYEVGIDSSKVEKRDGSAKI